MGPERAHGDPSTRNLARNNQEIPGDEQMGSKLEPGPIGDT